jgi:hypothetical protein
VQDINPDELKKIVQLLSFSDKEMTLEGRVVLMKQSDFDNLNALASKMKDLENFWKRDQK